MLVSWGGKHWSCSVNASASKGTGDHLEEKSVKARAAEGQQPEESPDGSWGKGRRKGESWLLFCLPVNLMCLGSFFSVCLWNWTKTGVVSELSAGSGRLTVKNCLTSHEEAQCESLTQAQLPSGFKTCGANNKQKGRVLLSHSYRWNSLPTK